MLHAIVFMTSSSGDQLIRIDRPFVVGSTSDPNGFWIPSDGFYLFIFFSLSLTKMLKVSEYPIILILTLIPNPNPKPNPNKMVGYLKVNSDYEMLVTWLAMADLICWAQIGLQFQDIDISTMIRNVN